MVLSFSPNTNWGYSCLSVSMRKKNTARQKNLINLKVLTLQTHDIHVNYY
jgi:hypothetical protein